MKASTQRTIHYLRRGPKGDTGSAPTITSTEYRYMSMPTTAGTPDPADFDYLSTEPCPIKGQNLWTRITYHWSNGAVTHILNVTYIPIDGQVVSSTSVDYSVQSGYIDPSALPNSAWQQSFPTNAAEGSYIYTRTTITFSGAEVGLQGARTVTYTFSKVGTGSHYAGIEEYYQITATATKPEAPVKGQHPATDQLNTTGWQTSDNGIPYPTKEKPYLWNFSISYDSSGTQYVAAPVLLARFGRQIVSIQEFYGISAFSYPQSQSTHPADIEEWMPSPTDTLAIPTAAKPYQWNKAVTTYTANMAGGTETETTYTITAIRGQNGTNGRGITTINELYKASASAEQAPQGDWEATQAHSGFSPAKPYLWSYTATHYTDNTQSYTTPHIIAVWGAKGATLRGPRDWNDLANGYQFQSGAAGEAFIDVVRHIGNYYICTASHGKASTYSPSQPNSQYWQLEASFDLVATKVLLAENARIDNLVAERLKTSQAAAQGIEINTTPSHPSIDIYNGGKKVTSLTDTSISLDTFLAQGEQETNIIQQPIVVSGSERTYTASAQDIINITGAFTASQDARAVIVTENVEITALEADFDYYHSGTLTIELHDETNGTSETLAESCCYGLPLTRTALYPYSEKERCEHIANLKQGHTYKVRAIINTILTSTATQSAHFTINYTLQSAKVYTNDFRSCLATNGLVIAKDRWENFAAVSQGGTMQITAISRGQRFALANGQLTINNARQPITIAAARIYDTTGQEELGVANLTAADSIGADKNYNTGEYSVWVHKRHIGLVADANVFPRLTIVGQAQGNQPAQAVVKRQTDNRAAILYTIQVSTQDGTPAYIDGSLIIEIIKY